MNALDGFIAYLMEQLDNRSIYVWGAQGQKHPVITEAWIRRMETSPADAERAIKYWTKRCNEGYKTKLAAFDCSGLGMYYLYNLKRIFPSDMNANGMRSKCESIKKDQVKRGDWVFRVGKNNRAYHIGYVIDNNGTVIEAKGRDDGVTKSKDPIMASYWTHAGRPRIY